MRANLRSGARSVLAVVALVVPLVLWRSARAAEASGEPALASSPAGSGPSSIGPSRGASLSVILVPTVVSGGTRGESGGTHRPTAAEPVLLQKAEQLDALLTEAIHDLGLTLDLSEARSRLGSIADDAELVLQGMACGCWVVSPRIDAIHGDYRLRIVAAPPHSKVLRVRIESVKGGDLVVRSVAMLRDLVAPPRPIAAADSASSPVAPFAAPAPATLRSLTAPSRSEGKAILATNATLFGGVVGYSLQRSSGSDDQRLLFPLMAIGTGFGLGASMLIAEEWDVGTGDAWFLSAGTWWPAAAGFMLAPRDARRDSDKYAVGLAGAAIGLTLATAELSFGGRMSEGGALVTHSVAAYGTFLGGIIEMANEGSASGHFPYRGAGIGAASGVVLGGILATRWSPPPARILSLDLGAVLGGLGGAAVATPLLIGESTPTKQRAFLIAAMGASAAGGGIAWMLSAHRDGGGAQGLFERLARYIPQPAWLGESTAGTGETAPILGAVVRGPL